MTVSHSSVNRHFRLFPVFDFSKQQCSEYSYTFLLVCMYAELPQVHQAIGPLGLWAAIWDLGSVEPPGCESFCPFLHVTEGKNILFLCGIAELR